MHAANSYFVMYFTKKKEKLSVIMITINIHNDDFLTVLGISNSYN